MKKFLSLFSTLLLIYLSGPTVALCETGIQLLKDGKTKYKIVISESPTYIEKRAAEVFQTYFKEISNVDLPIISDNHKKGKNEIILGHNKHLEALKADIHDVDLETDGFLIKTINKNLVIIGGSENDSSYLKRVKIARLPLEYIDLEIAKRKGKEEGGFFKKDADGSTRPRPEMLEKLESFYEICKESGVDFLKEGTLSPDEYLESNMRSVKLSSLEHLAIGCTVQSESKANLKFGGGDFSILTDGFRGSTDWSYAWLGFGDDMELIIDLGELKEISTIQPEFIFDQKRWMFLPDHVICSISEDGEHFIEVGKLTHDVPLQRKEALIKTFDFQFEKSKARYIKIYAKNIGVNPLWHRFSGGNASIIIDEIVVN